MRRLFWIVLLVGLSFPVLAQENLKEKEKSLEAFRRKLGKQKGQIQTLSLRERSLHSEMKDLATKIEGLDGRVSRLERDKGKASSRIDEAGEAIAELEKTISSGKENIKVRLRSLYRWDRPSLAKMLFSSTSPAEFRQRWWLVRRWIDADRYAIADYQSKVEELSEKRALLEDSHQKKVEVLSDLKNGRRDVRKERKRQNRLLALVKTQKGYYEKSVRELEQAAANLQQLIETLHREEVEEDSLFVQMRGKLALPVQGKLERKYGPYIDPKLRTRMHHKGIDLRASKGADVRSVFDGKVIYAGWFVGYGRVVIVDHGGGYFSLYAHLSTILKKIGESVVVGESIAKVGDTGSLKGAYLYFELRKRGISEDPRPWFSKETL